MGRELTFLYDKDNFLCSAELDAYFSVIYALGGNKEDFCKIRSCQIENP